MELDMDYIDRCVNTIVPPAVAVTSDRVAWSDTGAVGRPLVSEVVVTIVGTAGVTTDCSCPHVDDTARLLASPL